jgi:hypothetical protein
LCSMRARSCSWWACPGQTSGSSRSRHRRYTRTRNRSGRRGREACCWRRPWRWSGAAACAASARPSCRWPCPCARWRMPSAARRSTEPRHRSPSTEGLARELKTRTLSSREHNGKDAQAHRVASGARRGQS